jgi:dTDP-4-amino-4,6-dideoxygalactose transaminase
VLFSMIPGFSLTRQNAELEKELTKVILEVIRGGQFILGENVAKLEKEIADLCAVNYRNPLFVAV